MAVILLVEDNHEMLQALTDALKLNKHRVIPARSGEVALHVLNTMSAPPDLIITDFRMPDMNGIELMREIRNHPLWSNIPIALMSGQTDLETIDNPHANAFIPKPFKVQQLEDTVAQLVV